MKMQTDPVAGGICAALLYLALLLWLLAIAHMGCAHYPAPRIDDDVVDSTRTPAQRAESAVEVTTECGSGSGVLIDSVTVLTAHHVINCLEWPSSLPARAIAVRTADMQSSIASIEVEDGYRDLARLKLTTPISGIVPVPLRNAIFHDEVCAATARPERAFRCGRVEVTGDRRDHGDVTIRGANVWYGNSGSGVYDEHGMLVGILVRLYFCTPADALIHQLTDERVETCGGRVSSILDSPVAP